jgi:D-xylulose reductase
VSIPAWIAYQTITNVICSPFLAKASGAKKVIAVDISAARLKFAQSFAADGTFLPPRAEQGVDPVAHSEKIAALIKEQFNLGEGADVVLECTGAEPCIQAGINVAKKGGTYVQAGMGKEVSATCPLGCSREVKANGCRMLSSL